MIPKELQKEGMRFCLINKNTKFPIEKGWTTKGYQYNDEKLKNHLEKGGNYGTIGGYNNLIIIDFDNEELQTKIINKLPKTFTVKTGGGLLHLYYYSDKTESYKILDKNKETLADIQGSGKMVVAPGSTHPNGNKYEVYKDEQINEINYAELKALLEPYNYQQKKEYKEYEKNYEEDNLISEIKSKISIKSLLSEYGVNTDRNPTNCPFHSSKGGKCLSFKGDVWKCFHCDEGGDIFNLYMIKNNCDFKTTLKELKEKAGIKEIKKVEEFYKNDNSTYEELPVDVYQDNKINSAEQFWIKQTFFYDKTGLYWFWNKKDNCYEIIDETTLMNGLRKAANNSIIIKNKEWGEINRAMKLVGRDHIPDEVPKTWIQFKDTIIDWKTGQKIQIRHNYWNTNPIPWKCKKGEIPTINKFFNEWVGEKYLQTLKEIIAYCMIQDYPLHRIFCLTGSGCNGKGVFQSLLRKIIGEKNVISTELDLLMENRFETAKLYKKLVCQMGETNFTEISKTSMLKKLSGQDLVGVEFKNKNPFDTVNYAKLIINTNSLPPTMDKTDGFYRRWMIIDFPNKFPEGNDIISMIPDEEIEFLCYECVKLIPDLIKRGHFHNEGDILERKKKYEEKSNPINSFIKENYVKNPNGKIPIFDFEDNYNSYLSERGLRTVNRKGLIRLLKSDGFDIEREHVEHDGKWTKWTFVYGLQLLDTLDTLDTESHLAPLYRSEGKIDVQSVQCVQKRKEGQNELILTPLEMNPYQPTNENISTGTPLETNPPTPSKEIISTGNFSTGNKMSNLDFVWNFFEKGNTIYEGDLENNCLYNNRMTKTQFYDILMRLQNEGVIFEPKPGQWKKL